MSGKASVLEDIQNSGLSVSDLTKLKLEHCSEELITKVSGGEITDRAGYKIPYFSQTGKPTGFYRIKLFPAAPGKSAKKKGFGGVTGRVDKLKYYQPPNTAPQVYYPPLLKKSWKDILQDPSIQIAVTEGEKKAACGCKNNLPTLGLGGVWSWKSKKRDLPVLPELIQVNWKGRSVLLAFDSDSESNTQVMHALVSLGYALRERGADVEIIKIPVASKDKTGMDDYICAHGMAEFLDLPRQSLAEDVELHKLNEELAFIVANDCAYKLATDKFITTPILIGTTYANRFISKLSSAGVSEKQNAASEWLKWENRRTHSHLTYAPGQPRIIPGGGLNTWRGWGMEPKKGDITPWAELLEYAFDSAPEHKRWFLQWLAYPLQHPGTKLFCSVLLFSLYHGTGKSLIGYTMGRIYGEGFAVITQDELHSSFNDWSVRKQFILGEEITGSDSRAQSDRVKNMITREVASINAKFQPRYQLPDCCNYLLTSNHPDAQYLEAHDRRAFVHEIKGPPLPTRFYTKHYHKWKEGPGPAALMWHLLHNIDVKEFDPRAHAPMTVAKEDMRSLSKTDLDGFAEQLRSAPDTMLVIDGKVLTRALWTVAELLNLYDPTGSKRTTSAALSKALRRNGFDSRPTITLNGTQRLYAIRDPEKWWKAEPYEWRGHYDSAFQPAEKRKY